MMEQLTQFAPFLLMFVVIYFYDQTTTEKAKTKKNLKVL
jgi:preprotein translocase subunit YajC